MKFILIIAAMTVTAIAIPATAGASVARLHNGSVGPSVAQLQSYLRANTRKEFYNSYVDGQFGPKTESALKWWQYHNNFAPTGQIAIGSFQWNLLKNQATKTKLPKGIDPRATNSAKRYGWSVDTSKSTNMLYMLQLNRQTGSILVSLSSPTSFGGCNGDGCFVTPDGVHQVCRKAGADEVSHTWKDSQGNPAPMPWALYIAGDHPCASTGLAIHYDPLGNSHECIHVPVMWMAEYINKSAIIGAYVVVHR